MFRLNSEIASGILLKIILTKNFITIEDPVEYQIEIINQIQVNERIADLRPVPEVKDTAELERLKKNLQVLFRKKLKKKLNT